MCCVCGLGDECMCVVCVDLVMSACVVCGLIDECMCCVCGLGDECMCVWTW